MKTRLPFLLPCVLSLVVAHAFSQQADDAPQAPAGPLLRSAPDFSEWTVTCHYTDEQSPKAGEAPTPIPASMGGLLKRTRTETITKTGDIMRVVTVDIAGNSSEKWYDKGAQYTKPPGSTEWFSASNNEPADTKNAYFTQPLPASGFRDMEWINDQSYAGVIQLGEYQCLVFTPGGLHADDTKDAAKQRTALAAKSKVAYIDANSRLPIALRLPGEVRQFQFSDPPPSVALALPADLAAELQKSEAAVAKLLAPAGRPY
jgi:hypothetical protein